MPAYMIHQYEEHVYGRFVEFFNETVGRGRNASRPGDPPRV
ncbi:MAG TPA: hypothetical protein VHH10_09470 [Rubrobacteraceae bacterium]|nr:hypothetical protein [Rubrobacteraceae bacterium]